MTALGLSCSMWHLVPWSGIETRSLHQEQGVLATGPPGKSLDVVWKMGPSLTPKLSKRVANLLWRYCLAPASIVGSGDLAPQWVPKSWHHPTALVSSVINLQRALRCITFKPSRPQTPDCNRLVTRAPPDFPDLTPMSPMTSPSASPMLPFNPPPFLSLLLCTPKAPWTPRTHSVASYHEHSQPPWTFHFSVRWPAGKCALLEFTSPFLCLTCHKPKEWNGIKDQEANPLTHG